MAKSRLNGTASKVHNVAPTNTGTTSPIVKSRGSVRGTAAKMKRPPGKRV